MYLFIRNGGIYFVLLAHLKVYFSKIIDNQYVCWLIQSIKFYLQIEIPNLNDLKFSKTN